MYPEPRELKLKLRVHIIINLELKLRLRNHKLNLITRKMIIDYQIRNQLNKLNKIMIYLKLKTTNQKLKIK